MQFTVDFMYRRCFQIQARCHYFPRVTVVPGLCLPAGQRYGTGPAAEHKRKTLFGHDVTLLLHNTSYNYAHVH